MSAGRSGTACPGVPVGSAAFPRPSSDQGGDPGTLFYPVFLGRYPQPDGSARASVDRGSPSPTPRHPPRQGPLTASAAEPQLSGAGAELRHRPPRAPPTPPPRALPHPPPRAALCSYSGSASRGGRRGSPLILPAASSAVHLRSVAARARRQVCPGARPRRPVSGARSAQGRAWAGGPGRVGLRARDRSCGVTPRPRAGRRGRRLRLWAAPPSPGAERGGGRWSPGVRGRDLQPGAGGLLEPAVPFAAPRLCTRRTPLTLAGTPRHARYSAAGEDTEARGDEAPSREFHSS